MNNKIIILSLIIFLIAGFFYLAYIGQKQSDPKNQNFWVLYFADPKSDNLNFVIENHSDKNNFHWKVSSGNKKIAEGGADIKKGETKKIDYNIYDTAGKKITISVSDGENKKKVYKNFEK